MSDDFRQADGRFTKGNPGGPGRPRAPERAAALDLLASDAGADLIAVALEQAKGGNLKAIEMLLDRIWPVRRGRPVRVDAPEIRDTADLLPVGAALTNAVLTGDLTPEEGAAASRVLRAHESLIEIVDLERRMTAIQEKSEAAEAARRRDREGPK
jgi:hypothetical protein